MCLEVRIAEGIMDEDMRDASNRLFIIWTELLMFGTIQTILLGFILWRVW